MPFTETPGRLLGRLPPQTIGIHSVRAIPTPEGWAVPGNRWDLLDGTLPDRPPSVSVVVVHYRQPAELARTLAALRRQEHPAELIEIIVVDDGSPEPPVVPDGVRLIVLPDRGFQLAAARNAGAEVAHNDVLVFLDADTAPEPGYIRALTRLPALSWDAVTVGHRRHADFGNAVGPGAPVEVAGPLHELAEPAWLRDAYQRTHNLLGIDYRGYRFLIGAVLACTRRFFVETGGFDESFTQYGGEDWEWNYRAWLHGAVIAHVPDAIAWHDGPDSAGRADSASSRDRALATKNTEALRLSNLIPVPGSRGRAHPTTRADVTVVCAATTSTPGQTFVSMDSVLGELPGAVVRLAAESPEAVAEDPEAAQNREEEATWIDGRVPLPDGTPQRFDRVRIEVVIERPVRVRPGALTQAVTAIESDEFAEVVFVGSGGDPLLRLTSRRASARQNRWGGRQLLPTLELEAAPGVEELVAEVDVEAYLGGWG